jgi:5'-3' exonuclease
MYQHDEVSNVLSQPEFVNAFLKHMERDFQDFKKKYKAPAGNLWLMKDCSRCNIWRCGFFPEYKASRVHSESFDGGIFPIVYEYLETHKDRLGLSFLEQDKMEADDLVYLFQKYIRDKGYKCQIVVLANDNDYLQLVCDQVQVINKEGKHIAERGLGDPEKDLWKKILTGDKSDNIPSICTGMGPKTVQKLLDMSPEEREKWIREKGAWEQYLRNKSLIDMTQIPSELASGVYDQLENLKII